MSQQWRTIGNIVSDFIGPTFKPQTFHFGDQHITAIDQLAGAPVTFLSKIKQKTPNRDRKIYHALHHLKKSTVVYIKTNYLLLSKTMMYWEGAARRFTGIQANKVLILRQLWVPLSSYLISGFKQCAPSKIFRGFFFA